MHWKLDAFFLMDDADRLADFVTGRRMPEFEKRTIVESIRVEFVWIDKFIGIRKKKGEKPQRIMNILDADNRMKAPIDMVFGMMGIDDTYAKELSMKCVHSDNQKSFSMEIFKGQPMATETCLSNI